MLKVFLLFEKSLYIYRARERDIFKNLNPLIKASWPENLKCDTYLLKGILFTKEMLSKIVVTLPPPFFQTMLHS